MGNKAGHNDAYQANKQKNPPWTCAKMVFRLDDNGVEQAYCQKSAQTDDESREIKQHG